MYQASELSGNLSRSVPAVRKFAPRRVFPPRWLRCFALGLVSWGAFIAVGLAPAQEKPEEFAGIYLDKYLPPDGKLELQATGATRAQALAHYARGLAFENQKRPDEAIAAFLEVLKVSPGEFQLARKVAHLLAERGQRQRGR